MNIGRERAKEKNVFSLDERCCLDHLLSWYIISVYFKELIYESYRDSYFDLSWIFLLLKLFNSFNARSRLEIYWMPPGICGFYFRKLGDDLEAKKTRKFGLTRQLCLLAPLNRNTKTLLGNQFKLFSFWYFFWQDVIQVKVKVIEYRIWNANTN